MRQRILAADAALEPAHTPPAARATGLALPVPAQLPRDVGDFTGRTTELGGLLAGARQAPSGGSGAVEGVVEHGGRVVVVTGIGGSGKTALAVHAGRRLAARFPDGLLFADLRGTGSRPLAPAEVLARFLRALGLPGSAIPAGLDERAALYRSMLASRTALVVLDDARDAAQVRPLLPGCSSCVSLVTSRKRLTEP